MNTTTNNFIISKLKKAEIFSKNFYKKYKNHITFDDINSIVQFCLVQLANDTKIKKDETFDCYLYKSTKWKLLNEFRKNNYEIKKIKNLHELKKNTKQNSNQTIISNHEEILNFCKHLNLNQKNVFLLKHLDNKSNNDIAKKLNVTKSRISQILQKIYKKIKVLNKNYTDFNKKL